MADRNIVQELRLLGSIECPYGCDEVGNPAADAIEELQAERDASRLIISDLTVAVDRLCAEVEQLADELQQVASERALAESEEARRG